MNSIFTIIDFFKIIKITSIAIFFLSLGVGINTINAQVNKKEHYMFMHDLKHTGFSTYQDAQINRLKWKTITGNEIWSSPVVGSDNTVYVSSTDGNIFAYNPDGN